MSVSDQRIILIKKFLIYIFTLNCKHKQDVDCVLQVKIKRLGKNVRRVYDLV